jgi:GAF domain-containing protein
VAQHIESLRLLESAERYRAESEQASRRLTREGWKEYMESNTAENLSYIYDLKEVRSFAGNGQADESALSVPLKVRDEILGKFAIQGLDVNDSESIELANAVAERLGAHIESLRQADQTQSALAQSEKLFNATSALTQATDLQELVLAAVTTLNIPVVNRALLAVFNYAPDGKMDGMRVVANWWNGTGHEATAVGTYYSSEALRVLSIFTSPTPVFFNDMYNDGRVDTASLEVVKRLNVRAMVGLPLFAGPRQIGTLILEAEEVHNFSQEDIRLFTALAPQIATLLESRRQFEQAQKQAERESMLNAISQKIQSATSVEAVLQIAARELGHALSAPMTIAQLSMKDKS